MLVPGPGEHGARVVLTDFGIALSEEQSSIRLTRTGELVGTPAVHGPRAGRSRPVGPATDVYAFGLLLYEMLSGATPFVAGATPLGRPCCAGGARRRGRCASWPRSRTAWADAIHRCLERIRRGGFRARARALAALGGIALRWPPPPFGADRQDGRASRAAATGRCTSR